MSSSSRISASSEENEAGIGRALAGSGLERDAVFITTKLPFLSDGTYALWCAIAVNTWRGMPFFAITLLAGGSRRVHPLQLQTSLVERSSTAAPRGAADGVVTPG